MTSNPVTSALRLARRCPAVLAIPAVLVAAPLLLLSGSLPAPHTAAPIPGRTPDPAMRFRRVSLP